MEPSWHFPPLVLEPDKMACDTPYQRQRTVSTTGETLYEILGLHKGASHEEIKKTYRYSESSRMTFLMLLVVTLSDCQGTPEKYVSQHQVI